MTNDAYPFICGNPIVNRYNYAYVPFRGAQFLNEWRAARANVKNRLGGCGEATPELAEAAAPSLQEVRTADVLDFLMRALDSTPLSAEADAWIKWFIERFETSKRIFPIYSFAGKPARGRGECQDLALYVRLAEVLAKAYQTDGRLPALNALTKCMDTLCSVADQLTTNDSTRLVRLISLEGLFVDDLMEWRRGKPAYVGDSSYYQPECRCGATTSGPSQYTERSLDDTVLLFADTLRSRGYAQALLAEGFAFRAVLIIQAEGELRWGQTENIPPPPAASHFPDLFVPDLRLSLEETCRQLADNVELIDSGTINAPRVREQLVQFNPSLVIYSGFGGELVQPEILEAAGPVLHMHAGWLPVYRGSTTIYYSLLRERACGVSAILLTPQIDAGEILLRRWYSPPAIDVDFDYYYDSMIRADVLLKTLIRKIEEGKTPEGEKQDPSEGDAYYIIHPVLKHVAILSLSERA